MVENLHSRFNHDDAQVSPVRAYKYKRHDLAKDFGRWGLSKGAEIGVAEGRFSQVLFNSIPNLTLYAVDPYRVDKHDIRSVRIGQKEADRRHAEAIMTQQKNPGMHLFNMTSIKAAQKIPDDSLDFVYIDGCHDFDHAVIDNILWSQKVKPGGIISGHDYYHFRWSGVIQAIEIYTRMHRIVEYFITDERTPSYFWIKK